VKNYYQILEVEVNASQGEIKKSFRRLAIKYHPDKNPSVHAEELFKEINEAYDVLSDLEKKWVYDNRTLVDNSQTVQHRDPAYRRRTRPYTASKKKNNDQRELMLKYISLARWASRIALLFSIVILVDYLLPFQKLEEDVIDVQKIYVASRVGKLIDPINVKLVTSSGRELEVTYDFNFIRKDSSIEITQSPILNVPVEVISVNDESNRERIQKSIYRNLVFFPILLGILSIISLVTRNNLEMEFNLGIANFVFIILNLIFLIISIQQ